MVLFIDNKGNSMSWLANKKILVPIDFSELSKRAVEHALDMRGDSTEVHALFVAAHESVMEPGFVWGAMDDNTRRTNLEKEFEKDFGDPKFKDVIFHTLFGDAGHEIAEFVTKHEIALVVMSSHGRTGLERALIGSVAERVVRLCPCPVLVLKCKRPA